MSATLYLRRNGTFGAACDGVADTGHAITEDSGEFTVWSIDPAKGVIAENVSRREAEAAIAKDWRPA